jgi:pimeloyl-ACP methyl ester carboxylesterase
VAAGTGVRIAWDEAGAGEPVLFVHGLGYDRSGWGPAPSLLADRFRVITFDNRGVGESDAPPGPYTIAEMAADGAAVLDAAAVESAHVVGTSLGGMIAQELGLQNPERVDTLVLSSTTPGGDDAFPMPQASVELYAALADDPSPENLRRVVENSLSEHTVTTRPELVEEIVRYRLDHRPTRAAWLAQASAAGAFSSRSALAALDTPTLLIHGMEDNVVDPRNSELLAQALPDAELLLVPCTGHLADFLDRRGRRGMVAAGRRAG